MADISLRSENMTTAVFQDKIAEYYNAYRLELILASLKSRLFPDRANMDALYKERSAKSIYDQWSYLYRGVLEFIRYIKIRDNKPSGCVFKKD